MDFQPVAEVGDAMTATQKCRIPRCLNIVTGNRAKATGDTLCTECEEYAKPCHGTGCQNIIPGSRVRVADAKLCVDCKSIDEQRHGSRKLTVHVALAEPSCAGNRI